MGSQKSKLPRGYLPGLNGLRALAILLVFAFHLWPQIIVGGYIGVDVFFVISGFLITSLLIKEQSEKGRINLKAFWTRRARRLLPALLVVISITSTFALLLGGDILVGIGRQILGALTFSNNWAEIAAGTNYFSSTNVHVFTNFWSLAVEEQFYAVWPLCVVAFLWFKPQLTKYRRGLIVSIVLSISSAILMAYLFKGTNLTRLYYGTDTHAFGLMLGAAIAFWGNARYAQAIRKGVKHPTAQFKHRSFVQGSGCLALAVLIVMGITLNQHAAFAYLGGLYGIGILTAVIILATVSSKGILRKLLEARLLTWIGERSYGMYLWHWPIIVLLHYWLGATSNQPLPVTAAIALTISLAALSYRYIELPVRRVGFKALFTHAIKRKVTSAELITPTWRLQPHPLLFISLLLLSTTVGAVITAPRTTQAEQRVAKGEAAISAANHAIKAEPVVHVSPQKPITGADMTLVGDSVSLASAPELQVAFPGIYIDAQVSRSMRRGGLETIEQLLQTKTMRRVLIVALGTNGYYGDGFIERLMNEVGKDHEVLFVTAHAPNEWSPANNNSLRSLLPHYQNMYIADWDTAISAHPELLGPDGIHPGLSGGVVYAECIKAALAEIPRHM
ncbi:MAG TPA: acyltransferase family protein [Candidatus Saccharimonadales bacterium]